MKNYKILAEKDRNSFFNRLCFNKEQHELLLRLGYIYSEFHNTYEKTYRDKDNVYNTLNIVIPLGKEYFYYYDSRFNTLAELNEKANKNTIKDLRIDIREMKKVGITK